jgi:hypothetical protein
MFLALLVGSVVALSGLAGGILGMLTMGLFLVSIMVFFWELVLRADDLQVDVPASQQADTRRRDRKAAIKGDWITDYDWIGEQAHRSQGYHRQADNIYSASHVRLSEPGTTPLQIVPGRRPSRLRKRKAA